MSASTFGRRLGEGTNSWRGIKYQQIDDYVFLRLIFFIDAFLFVLQDVYQRRNGLHNHVASEKKSTNKEKREKQHCRYKTKRNRNKGQNKVIITNYK